MYEDYTRQALPPRDYRELLGSAVCVFNSNNAFVIENILNNDENKEYNWHDLIDKTSGRLENPIKKTITANSSDEIANLFTDLVDIRNRIIHSFQVTGKTTDGFNIQILATKYYKDGKQEHITKEFLLNFIKKNEELSTKLHEFRKGMRIHSLCK